MKRYIKPETAIVELFVEEGILEMSRLNNEVVTSEEYSGKKDWNGADIWSGEISWGYDADE